MLLGLLRPYTRPDLPAHAGVVTPAVRPPPRTPYLGPDVGGAYEEAMREEDVSAEQPETEEEARLPAPDAHARGSRRDRSTARQGPQPSVGLIWRVRGRRSFQALARGRRRRSGGLEVSVAVLGAPSDPPRVAYTVSRSHGSAVARNLTRRRLRSAVRANAGLLEPGCGYLFRPLEPIPGRLQADIVAAVADVLRAAQGPR